MKNLIINLLCLVVINTTFWSCARLTDEELATPKHDSVRVSFELYSPDPFTRALSPENEQQIKDLNIYLFHKTTDIHKHLFADGGTEHVITNVVPGEYDVFVIANTGKDIGEQTRDILNTYVLEISNEDELISSNTLPLSAFLSLSIRENSVVPISLTRAVAKVNLALSVASEWSDRISLESVQVLDAPCNMALFSDMTSSDRIDYEKQQIEGNSLDYTFYILENLRGVNASITDQQDKNAANAPEGATLLYIRGTADGKQVSYSIYLGANNTTDFNIARNRRYVIQATICGINTVDTRVSTVEISLGDVKNPCTVGESLFTHLTVFCTNAPKNQIFLTAQVLEGGGTLSVNGYEQLVSIPLCRGDETKTVPISYIQEQDGTARLRFTLSDQYGYVTHKEATTQYYHPVLTSYSEQSWSKEAHTPLNFTIRATQKKNSTGFSVHYELLQGSGEMYYNGVKVTAGTTFQTGLSDPETGKECPFRFTPTSIENVRFRLTFTGANGQKSIVDKTYSGIKPYVVHITPDYQVVRTGLATLSGVKYYRNLTVRVLASADRPVPYNASLSVSLFYTVGYYETTSSSAEITSMNTSASIRIVSGEQDGHTDLETYQGCCMTRSSGTIRVYAPGYYIKEKSSSTFTQPIYDARLNIYRLTVTPQDNSVEYIVEDPVK